MVLAGKSDQSPHRQARVYEVPIQISGAEIPKTSSVKSLRLYNMRALVWVGTTSAFCLLTGRFRLGSDHSNRLNNHRHIWSFKWFVFRFCRNASLVLVHGYIPRTV